MNDNAPRKNRTFGKHRTYHCPCGRTCLREIWLVPHDCKCGRSLLNDNYRIDDVVVGVRNQDLLKVDLG